MNHSPQANKSFRILSLDGGGARGVFIAACLAQFEKQLNNPITKYFDLIAGTSTGGIIALALGLGVPASKIEDFYVENCSKIFLRRQPVKLGIVERFLLRVAKLKFENLDADWIFQCKYESDVLKATLGEIFGKETLEDAIHCRLVIPAVDLVGGQTVVFKTPHLPGLIRDRSLLAVDVGVATAAAPTFFPHATIGTGSAYCDGGLWANNPSMVSYAEALKIRQECNRPGIDPIYGDDEIALLSIGTGSPRSYVKPRGDDSGLKWWGPRLVNVMMVSQSQGEHFKAKYILGNRYHRIDFRIPGEDWGLDTTEAVQEMSHIGHQKAAEHFADIETQFLTVEKSPLVFFES